MPGRPTGPEIKSDPERFERFLKRIAPDGEGGVSPERLEAWLLNASGKVVDGYCLHHKRDPDGKFRFWLTKAEDQ